MVWWTLEKAGETDKVETGNETTQQRRMKDFFLQGDSYFI